MKVLVSDPRQDLILQEFVDQGKWKTALDHCDKRLKKLKKATDHRLELNYLLVELKLHLSQGALPKEDLVKVISSHSAFIDYLEVCDDFEIIEQIEDCFDHAGGDLWKRAVKIGSKDEEIYQAWFDVKFKSLEFRYAAEACMHWRVGFPQKSSELSMKMILCYHLSSKGVLYGLDPTYCPEDQRAKDARMAVLLANQAVKATPAKTSKDNALQATSDLELIVDVLVHNNLHEQAIAILADSEKGLKSSMGSWDLMRIYGRLLAFTERYRELFVFCRQLLGDALQTYTGQDSESFWSYGDAGDDSEIIKLAILAVLKLDEPDTSKELESLLNNLAEARSFNATLQMVNLRSQLGSEKQCLSAACQFYKKYKSKGQALALLQYLPEKLAGHFVSFLMRSSEAEEIPEPESVKGWSEIVVSRNNNLRMRYDLFLSQSDDVAALTVHILECIWFYMSARGAEPQKQPADDCVADPALIVAVRALIRLWYLGDHAALSQARVLLEFMTQYSKYNYEALLLLVRICKTQGAVSMAFSYYRRLEIKNTQQINEANIFFQGISSLHPRSASRTKFSPEVALDAAHAWASKRKQNISNQALACIDHKNWIESCQAVEFRARWTEAPGYVCVTSEAYRTQLRDNSTKESPVPAAFAAIARRFTDPKTGRVAVERIQSSTQVPLTHQKELTILQKFYHSDVQTSFATTLIIAGLQAIVRDLPSDFEPNQLHAILHEDLPTNNIAFKIPIALVRLIISHSPGRRMDEKGLQMLRGLLESGQKLIHDQIAEPVKKKNSLLASSITKMYDLLDVLDLIHDAVSWADRRGSTSKDVRDEAQEMVRTEKALIAQWAGNAIEAADQDTSMLLQGKIGEAIEALVGAERVREFAEANHKSAVETLGTLLI